MHCVLLHRTIRCCHDALCHNALVIKLCCGLMWCHDILCPSGAGQDLMLVAGPERCSSYIMEADTRAVHAVPSCKGPTGPCVAVGGKAYLLGRHGSAAVSCFDPYVSCW
jgi:hypothetical protein